MRVAVTFAFLVSAGLASACGGQVQIDRDGGDGGGGSSGSQGAGGALSCEAIECEQSGSACSCITDCDGPDLRADCDVDPSGEIVCECHYDNAYMGLCSTLSGSVCGLPSGCCYVYVP